MNRYLSLIVLCCLGLTLQAMKSKHHLVSATSVKYSLKSVEKGTLSFYFKKLHKRLPMCMHRRQKLTFNLVLQPPQGCIYKPLKSEIALYIMEKQTGMDAPLQQLLIEQPFVITLGNPAVACVRSAWYEIKLLNIPSYIEKIAIQDSSLVRSLKLEGRPKRASALKNPQNYWTLAIEPLNLQPLSLAECPEDFKCVEGECLFKVECDQKVEPLCTSFFFVTFQFCPLALSMPSVKRVTIHQEQTQLEQAQVRASTEEPLQMRAPMSIISPRLLDATHLGSILPAADDDSDTDTEEELIRRESSRVLDSNQDKAQDENSSSSNMLEENLALGAKRTFEQAFGTETSKHTSTKNISMAEIDDKEKASLLIPSVSSPVAQGITTIPAASLMPSVNQRPLFILQQSVVLQQAYNTLKAKLKERGLLPVPTSYGNNSQFQACAKALQRPFEEVKNKALVMLNENWLLLEGYLTEHFGIGGLSDYGDYIEKARQSQLPGNLFTLAALAFAYNCNIHIIDENDIDCTIQPLSQSSTTITIGRYAKTLYVGTLSSAAIPLSSVDQTGTNNSTLLQIITPFLLKLPVEKKAAFIILLQGAAKETVLKDVCIPYLKSNVSSVDLVELNKQLSSIGYQ
jgi:hypothetical protein